MSTARPVIALVSDFGVRDHYVGVMKGVMLGICPTAVFVDLSHDIPPQNVMAGALVLEASYRYFPAGTVFLGVVDPGVGTARRALAVSAGKQQFVAPDNGLLAGVLAQSEAYRAVQLESAAHTLPSVSRTFEGRDRLAPAAAWLALGTPLDALGPTAADVVARAWPAPQVTPLAIDGEVIAVDHFGNLMSNITRQEFERLAPRCEVSLNGRRIAHVVATYAEAPVGSGCALIGSTDRLEIAVRNGSAASRFDVGVGARVVVRALA